jgi:hypothetical protein
MKLADKVSALFLSGYSRTAEDACVRDPGDWGLAPSKQAAEFT